MQTLSIYVLIVQLVFVRGNDFQKRCEALSNARYFRGSCFVFVTSNYYNPSNDLGNACTHMKEKGFLALVTGKTLFNMLRLLTVIHRDRPGYPDRFQPIQYTTWGSAGGLCWIGLKQFDAADEPKGGWFWHVPGIGKWEVKAEPITMWKGNPDTNETNYAGLLWQTTDQASFIDDKTAFAGTYICQYDSAENTWAVFTTNHQPNSTYVAAEIHGSTGEVDCAIFCSRFPICRSFGYDINTTHCYAYYVEAEDLVFDEDDKIGFSVWVRQ